MLDDLNSHPKDASEVLVQLFWPVAATAAREDSSGLRRAVASQDELIFMSAAGRAGFAAQFSADRADFPDLFLHIPSSRCEGADRFTAIW